VGALPSCGSDSGTATHADVAADSGSGAFTAIGTVTGTGSAGGAGTTQALVSQNLLAYIKQLPLGSNGSMLTGQHCDARSVLQPTNDPYGGQLDQFQPWPGATPANATITTTGLTPAILGTWLCLEGQQATAEQNLALINGWNAAGGITLVTFTPPNPMVGLGYRRDTSAWTEVKSSGLGDITTVGSAVYNMFVSGTQSLGSGYSYGGLADLAAQLKQINGQVLFRPLQEMNLNFGNFWWDATYNSPEKFRQLWKLMFNYLVNEQGLDNLVWVWDVNMEAAGADYSAYFPGTEYVQVMGIDCYTNYPYSAFPAYTALKQIADLPIMIPECGLGGGDNSQKFITANDSAGNGIFSTVFRQYMPDIFATCIFAGDWSLSNQDGARQYLSDSWSVTRQMLPQG
jgi:hypothetical protein